MLSAWLAKGLMDQAASPTRHPQPTLRPPPPDNDPHVRHHVDPKPNPDACRRSLMHAPRYWRRYDAFWRSAPLSSPNRKYPPLSADPPSAPTSTT